MSGSEDEEFSENSSIRRQNVRRILSETRTMPEFSNSDESEMDYESAEENLVEVENNQPMENPQIEIGSNIVALENDQLKVTFSRIQLKRNLKFKLTDIHYKMKIQLKENQENILLKESLPLIIQGLESVIQSIKEKFSPDLDRDVLIKFAQNGLQAPIKMPVSNLQNDSVDTIVEKIAEKLAHVLESHNELRVDGLLSIFIVGKRYIKFLDDFFSSKVIWSQTITLTFFFSFRT